MSAKSQEGYKREPQGQKEPEGQRAKEPESQIERMQHVAREMRWEERDERDGRRGREGE